MVDKDYKIGCSAVSRSLSYDFLSGLILSGMISDSIIISCKINVAFMLYRHLYKERSDVFWFDLAVVSCFVLPPKELTRPEIESELALNRDSTTTVGQHGTHTSQKPHFYLIMVGWRSHR